MIHYRFVEETQVQIFQIALHMDIELASWLLENKNDLIALGDESTILPIEFDAAFLRLSMH